MEGWISLHRKLMDNELWLSEPFTKAQAWVDLLLLANHKDGIINVRGNMLDVKRGQVGWSEVRLAKRWRWSREKVRRYLKWLETRQQIEQQKNNVSSILTIVNYERYQETTQQTGQQTRQQKDNRQDTNNNDNNENNILSKDNRKPKASTLISFKKDKDVYLQKAQDQYPSKDCKKALEDFISYCEVKSTGYKAFDLAFYRWVREDRFNQYNKPKPIPAMPVYEPEEGETVSQEVIAKAREAMAKYKKI